ncbi:MAG: hypothetical protein A3H59_01505 [Candidatus Jacksonbacteria bacterium RIFCSPLOWO2_02_FULL_43_9]|nr:MAG: hypothetical protein UV70_C0003G0014 [Parcubacteria group bacterium GW2011_GWA2_43_13]OGY68552.1 MAG: hypothetical protein A3B94_00625 [Candidatus Jacksonbacteria bacterium RIFCSPHIGHO2_02_FULL_43_10]OGY70547.1 MAG: hypothetical protein A2986_02415 [Candidatus Jacksonbacteria bacterium RIFCSPLOWO2_01_FULL_44_13]OGY72013.1 MAG: hypothetical protein A3H59_01505 [Candidatus Jacksonbacteria bacterium RIFCSPLOWO2_02_FULL_43_9]HAZ16319.1 hypothetical protein [Candidatus Jacksonbacteria bacter
MKQFLQYVITFGVPVLVLALMLAPFFIFRKARGWLGSWPGAILRWGVGVGIWYLTTDVFFNKFYYSTLPGIDSANIVLILGLFIFFLLWPFFGFNLAQGNKLTKSIIFQLIVGLINVAVGIFILIMAIPWGLAGLGGL